jgi:ParB/RepB/Spo0J family partition protein
MPAKSKKAATPAADAPESVHLDTPAPALKPIHIPAHLRHDQIIPDPDNARTSFDEAELAGLADTLFTHGMKQPIRCLPAGADAKWQMFMGERRWRAWGKLIADGRWPAGHTELVLVEAADELARLEAGLIENRQRVNLNHREAGLGFEKLAQRCGRSNKQIAEAIGRTPEFVQQHRRLAKLSDDHQLAVREGKLAFQDALRILSQPKPHEPTPAELLALAEIAYAIILQHKSFRQWAPVEVAPAAADPAIEWWRKNYILAHQPRDYQTLRGKVELTYNGPDHIKKLLPEFSDGTINDDVHALLDRLRTEAHGADVAKACRAEGRYASPWLNGPFKLSEADQAELDRRAANAKSEAVKAAKAKAKLDAVRKEAKALGQKVRKGDAGAPELQAAIEDLGLALPLTLSGSDVRDAKGKMICCRGYSYSSNGLSDDAKEQAMRLLVLAANLGLQFAKTAKPEEARPQGSPPTAAAQKEASYPEGDAGGDDAELSPALLALAGAKPAAAATVEA